MRPHVLVVDDSLTVRVDLRTGLATAGFAVTTCSTIASARTWLDTHTFDLAILDVMLPDGSGIEILQKIRETVKLQSTPVIMLSTPAEVSSRIRGLRLGADRYVGKPYEQESVVRIARELVKVPAPRAQLPSQRSPNRRKKLLLVDDSPTFINSLAAVLRKDNYEVVMAYSGEDAVELLTLECFDAVLIDLVLPGIDGAETCRRLRAIKGMEHTPVVLMTATANRVSRTDALAAGADELLLKSADLSMVTTQLLCLFITKRQLSRPAATEPALELPSRHRATAQQAALLYQRVIAASGLSALMAKTLINRTFHRLGIDPTMLTPANLAQALHPIQETLRTFLPAGEYSQRIAGIAALIGVGAIAI